MRKCVIFLVALCFVFSGCGFTEEYSSEIETIALETQPTQGQDIVHMVHPDVSHPFSYAEGEITGFCRILPQPGHARTGDGIFRICADQVEMNQGSHYDAVLAAEQGTITLPRSYFRKTITVFGQPVTVEFEYALHNGHVIITYVSADAIGYRIDGKNARNGIVPLFFEVSGGERYQSCPMYLDLRTREFTDLFSGFSSEQLPDGAILCMDHAGHQILVRMTDGRYFLYDLPQLRVLDVSELAQGPVKAACLAGDALICFDGEKTFHKIDLVTYASEQILKDAVSTELFYGLSSATNQTFALYRQEDGQLRYCDFLTMTSDTLSEPQGWAVKPDYLYPSPDGRKVFLYQADETGCYQLLIFDCDRQHWLQLDRGGSGSERDQQISWTWDDAIAICTESGQKFYLYQWKAQDTYPMQTEETLNMTLQDQDFAAVKDYIPDLLVEMKYAYPENFTGHAIYEFQDAYLRYGTIQKLMLVQQELKTMGLGLKLWDGFRPVSAQFKLWEIYPDDTYVANPNIGFSSHSRGNTVDITLVDAAGQELEMPTEFDDFSGKADRNYADCTETAAANARLLESVMEKYGFKGYYGEWWHFADTVKYDVERCFDPSVISTWKAECREYITLRKAPDPASDPLELIPTRETMTLLGYAGDFALVDYRGQRGYVLSSYIKPY